MRRRLALGILFLAAAAALRAADTYTIDKAHSDVSFTIRHFASKVHGRFADFEGAIQADSGKPEASSVVFTIKSTSIDTNNSNRDNDLRSDNFFDVAKFPEITFKSSKIATTGKDTYAVTGTFTMHGVSKEITLPVTYLGTMKDPRGNERASFELNTKLNRKDFGINWNRSLDNGGLMLSDDVDVTVDLETVRKAPEAPAAK
ncbi:MAG TPA: YceI family protein [Thermoanaerobaculia bacterium]|nr:YceI family protein [Thermoanaerobaculia bacterium]